MPSTGQQSYYRTIISSVSTVPSHTARSKTLFRKHCTPLVAEANEHLISGQQANINS